MAPIQTDLTEMVRAALNETSPARERQVALALTDVHPADVAAVMRSLEWPDALVVFNTLDAARAAEALDELDPALTRYLVDHAPAGRIADLLDRLPMDDAAEVVAEATIERAKALLIDLTARAPEDAAEVEELLAFPEQSAGRLMTTDFASVPPEATSKQILDYLRGNALALETLNAVYVVGRGRNLLGVASIRQILTAGEWQQVQAFMTPNPISVAPETDQQEVAHLIARYDLLAIPVVDARQRIVGIVTVDDVIDVLIEEFTEDYLRLAGSDAEAMDRRSSVEVARLRLPWLLGTMSLELVSGLVIANFNHVLQQVILLASFMPVISAISGNVGLQSAAVVVRGLDTGHVSLSNAGRQVGKEVRTSLLLALACGLVLGTIGALWSRHIGFGIVIGGALLASMLTAGLMGSIIPMLSKRLGFDPATTAGPFETAFQDVIGFAVFLWLASQLIQFLR